VKDGKWKRRKNKDEEGKMEKKEIGWYIERKQEGGKKENGRQKQRRREGEVGKRWRVGEKENGVTKKSVTMNTY
jgi:hypothetical protein